MHIIPVYICISHPILLWTEPLKTYHAGHSQSTTKPQWQCSIDHSLLNLWNWLLWNTCIKEVHGCRYCSKNKLLIIMSCMGYCQVITLLLGYSSSFLRCRTDRSTCWPVVRQNHCAVAAPSHLRFQTKHINTICYLIILQQTVFYIVHQLRCTYPQLVSSMEPSTCNDAMPKSATRMLFFSSSNKFSGFKSRWLQTRHKVRFKYFLFNRKGLGET